VVEAGETVVLPFPLTVPTAPLEDPDRGLKSPRHRPWSAEGQRLVQRLIVDAGILITNVAGRQWHSYETLRAQRPDLIHLEVLGRADASTGVDYTVNAATGFPLAAFCLLPCRVLVAVGSVCPPAR